MIVTKSQEVERIFSAENLSQSSLSLSIESRTHGPCTPNAEVRLEFSDKRVKTLIGLGTAAWYLPYGALLLLELEQVKLENLEDQEILWTILASKESMLTYYQTFRKEALYPKAKALQRYLETVKVKILLPRRPRTLQRHRGYKDHGALRSADKWQETRDWSLTEGHLQLEVQKDFLERTKNSIYEYGLLGVRLRFTE